MQDRRLEMRPSLTTHDNKRKNILTLETLGRRLCRAVNPVILVSSLPEYSLHRIHSVAKGIRRKSGKPLHVHFSSDLETLSPLALNGLLEETDLILSFSVKDTEHKAACFLLDSKNSGAYTIGVGKGPRTDYTSVNFYIKNQTMPGALHFLIVQLKGIAR